MPFPFAALLAAAPSIAGVASKFFGGKKKVEQTQAPTTVGANLPLEGFYNHFIRQYQPGKEFSGGFGALGEMTDFERTGLDRLSRLLSSPETGDLFGGAQQQVLDTLGGKFADPNESPFIRSAMNLSKMNLSDALDAVRARRGGRGTFFTQEGIEEEGRTTSRSLANLDTIIGDFINQERGRQSAAVPQALALEGYGRDVALGNIEATQSYGALPRALQIAQLEAEYGDFGRKQKELGGVVSGAQSIYQPARTYPGAAQEVETGGTLGNILSIISKLNLGALSGKGSLLSKLPAILQGIK